MNRLNVLDPLDTCRKYVVNSSKLIVNTSPEYLISFAKIISENKY